MSHTTETQQLWMHVYAVLVANSILVYDHMMTLPEEITFIWRRPKARSAILFLVNRYVALLGNIFGLCIDFLPNSDEVFILVLECLLFAQRKLSCVKYTLCRQLLFFSQGIIVCLVLTVRLYALYGRSKRLLSCMTIIGLTLAAGACAGTLGHFSSNATILPGVGCYETYTAAVAARIGLAWVALFVFELIIFVLLIYRICKTRGLPRLSLFTRSNVIDIIFHDSVMYFGAMTLVGIPNILTYYSGSVNTRGSLATFTNSMSATLISRLVLNLHESADTGILSTTVRDDSTSFALLTTRVNVQSAISSHHC